jgi:hypothetical protein
MAQQLFKHQGHKEFDRAQLITSSIAVTKTPPVGVE